MAETIMQLSFVPLPASRAGDGVPSIAWDTQPPVTGQWLSGDIVYNTNPVSGGPTGWICTSSGFPGLWTTLPETVA